MRAIGAETEGAASELDNAGMPSEWRCAIWSAIGSLDKHLHFHPENRNCAQALLMVCYSVLQAFRVSSEWQQIVEATSRTTFRELKSEIIDELKGSVGKKYDVGRKRRFSVVHVSGKVPKKLLRFEELAQGYFEMIAGGLQGFYRIDIAQEIDAGSDLFVRHVR